MSKFDDINIPKDIDKITKSAMVKGRIEKNKKKNSNIIIVATATIFVLIGIIGMGIINPSLVSAAPKIKQVFEDLNKNLGLNKEYTKHSQGIGQTQTKSNVSISIDEAVSDGHNLFLTYVIKSKDKLPGRQNHENRKSETLHMENNISIKQGNLSGAIGLEGYYKDDYTYVGVEMYEIYYEYGKVAPKEIDLDISIKSISAYAGENIYKASSRIYGPFEFNINVHNNADVEVLNVNKSKDKFTIKSVEVSPYSINVNVKLPKDFAKKAKNGFDNIISIDTAIPHQKNVKIVRYDLDNMNQATASIKGDNIYDSILINYKTLRYEKPEYIVVNFIEYNKPSETATTSIKIYLDKDK